MVGLRVGVLAGVLATLVSVAGCGNSDKEKPSPSATSSDVSKAGAASASSEPLYIEGSESGAEGVQETLKKKYPNMPVADIKRLNVTGKMGMYEFIAGQQVAYTNEGVDFLLVGGEMLTGSGESAVNLTEKSLKIKMNDAFKTIPTEGALRYVYGDGSRQVIVFSDPDCPYCQALEFMFDSNKDNLNATVLIVPYPIDSLHPQADAKSRYILCTKNPDAAWNDWMLSSAVAVSKGEKLSWDSWAAKNPSSPGCDRAKLVDKVKAYGKTYGFNQTPILMFSNGMPFLGLLDRNELEKAWTYVKTGQVPPQ